MFGSTLSDAFAGTSTLSYHCMDRDPGAAKCVRHCSDILGSNAKAFTVRGYQAPPAPPPPTAPPVPPQPPPSPTLPDAVFNGANDNCRKNGLIGSSINFCTDSGPRSVAVNGLFGCPYGSQNSECGPRPDVSQDDFLLRDNSCVYAHDGECQDGGPGSVFAADAQGQEIHLCLWATDTDDCEAVGQLRRAIYGSLTYGTADLPTAPLPPPSPPPLPPPPLPPLQPQETCLDTCENKVAADGTGLTTQVCSDGGEGAYTVPMNDGTYEFKCDFGTQVCSLMLLIRPQTRPVLLCISQRFSACLRSARPAACGR